MNNVRSIIRYIFLQPMILCFVFLLSYCSTDLLTSSKIESSTSLFSKINFVIRWGPIDVRSLSPPPSMSRQVKTQWNAPNTFFLYLVQTATYTLGSPNTGYINGGEWVDQTCVFLRRETEWDILFYPTWAPYRPAGWCCCPAWPSAAPYRPLWSKCHRHPCKTRHWLR